MLYCHGCKLEPSTVAHFSLTLPDSSGVGDLMFSGHIEMSFSSGERIFETDLDIFPVLVLLLTCKLINVQ